MVEKLVIVDRKLQHRRTKEERKHHIFIQGLVEDGGDTHELQVDPRQGSRDRLEVSLHEWLHHLVEFVDKDEDVVRKEARKLRNALWKDGWRRMVEEKWNPLLPV